MRFFKIRMRVREFFDEKFTTRRKLLVQRMKKPHSRWLRKSGRTVVRFWKSGLAKKFFQMLCFVKELYIGVERVRALV